MLHSCGLNALMADLPMVVLSWRRRGGLVGQEKSSKIGVRKSCRLGDASRQRRVLFAFWHYMSSRLIRHESKRIYGWNIKSQNGKSGGASKMTAGQAL